MWKMFESLSINTVTMSFPTSESCTAKNYYQSYHEYSVRKKRIIEMIRHITKIWSLGSNLLEDAEPVIHSGI